MNEVKTSMEELDEGKPVKLPSFFERLTAIFVEPKVVFDFLAHKTDFWLSFLVLAILMAVGQVLSLPVTMQAAQMGMDVKGIEMTPVIKSAISIGTPIQTVIMMLIALAVSGAIIWLVTIFTSGGTTYAKAVSVATWISYPGALAMLINGIVVMAVKPTITSIQMAQIESTPVMHYTSLAALIQSGNPYIMMLLGTISLFVLWSFWLLYIGVKRSLGGTAVTAAVLIIIMYLFQVGIAMIQANGIAKA